MRLSPFRFLMVSACLSLAMLLPTSANAQLGVSQQVLGHAQKVASACIHKWENQTCLTALSNSNMDMIINYAQSLKNNHKSSAIEDLKNVCAASTAAQDGEYPAYAMNSAFTECANGMYDLSVSTGIKPDQSHYQLIVAAVMCLSKSPQCRTLQGQLQKYAR